MNYHSVEKSTQDSSLNWLSFKWTMYVNIHGLPCLLLISRMLEQQDYEQQEEAFDNDEEEPVFVLTDEWREFFARSEAKRNLGSVLVAFAVFCFFISTMFEFGLFTVSSWSFSYVHCLCAAKREAKKKAKK